MDVCFAEVLLELGSIRDVGLIRADRVLLSMVSSIGYVAEQMVRLDSGFTHKTTEAAKPMCTALSELGWLDVPERTETGLWVVVRFWKIATCCSGKEQLPLPVNIVNRESDARKTCFLRVAQRSDPLKVSSKAQLQVQAVAKGTSTAILRRQSGSMHSHEQFQL
nr:hypothetical protein CFP56_30055 [Quercus suber]